MLGWEGTEKEKLTEITLTWKKVHDNTLGGFGVYNEQREASIELSTDFDNPRII